MFARMQVCSSKSFVLDMLYTFWSPVTDIQLLVRALLESINKNILSTCLIQFGISHQFETLDVETAITTSILMILIDSLIPYVWTTCIIMYTYFIYDFHVYQNIINISRSLPLVASNSNHFKGAGRTVNRGLLGCFAMVTKQAPDWKVWVHMGSCSPICVVKIWQHKFESST